MLSGIFSARCSCSSNREQEGRIAAPPRLWLSLPPLAEDMGKDNPAASVRLLCPSVPSGGGFTPPPGSVPRPLQEAEALPLPAVSVLNTAFYHILSC